MTSAVDSFAPIVSYYQDTAFYPNRYPMLAESLDTEVCVIGGGFSGVNTALELAERGCRVVLLEARHIGWGASGRNGGQLIRGIGHGLEPFRQQIGDEGIAAIQQMGLESVEIVVNRINTYGIHCDLKMGYCDLATKARHWRHFEEDFAWLKAQGYPHELELIPQQRIAEVVGSDHYTGALLDWGSGHLHPLNLVCGEAAAAVSLGVKMFENSPVLSIQHGDRVTVKTARGQVRADKLVICGNAHVGDLDKTLKARVLPAGSFMIATEPLPADVHQRLLPRDTAACDSAVVPTYFRLSADKRLIFGGRCNYSGRNPASIKAALQPMLVRLFPALKNVRIDYEWGGMLGIGANRLPQIGRLQPNVYYAQAYAGHGLNATHMAARLIAESVCRESERLVVFEKVRHMGFPGGDRLRSPILALGMLYHRFIDWF